MFEAFKAVWIFLSAPFLGGGGGSSSAVTPSPTPNPTPPLGPPDVTPIVVNDTLGLILQTIADNWVIVACVAGGLLFWKYFRSR